MNARTLKDALHARHPATINLGWTTTAGAWTVVEELLGIDVLAISAWAKPQPSFGRVAYPRVGYEVKVSRSDYRRELLKPGKRARAVSWCHAFFMAVPKGLLKPEEIAYDEPEWEPQDFIRTPCPVSYGQPEAPKGWREYPGTCRSGERIHAGGEIRKCGRCEGKGYLTKSRVEREAPMLWVPKDVGLVVVDGVGCKVVKPAPISKTVPDVTSMQFAQMIRWVSVRPDPRHRSVRGGLDVVVS